MPLNEFVMTRFKQNALEASAAIIFIALGTLIVHLVMSWWSQTSIALAACGTKLDGPGAAGSVGLRRPEVTFVTVREADAVTTRRVTPPRVRSKN